MQAQLALPPAASLSAQFARDAHVICHGALPPGRAGELRDKALQIARRHARRIEQPSTEHPLSYRVVTGDVIAAEWPELFAVYRSSDLQEWVAAIVGACTLFPSSHLRSAININVMGEPGEIYRWHTDASGFTLLLYLSDSREEDGGRLEMRGPGARGQVAMLPAAGAVVLMDGTRCLHRVAPIARRHERISIPMVFNQSADQQRPEGLDDYLYGASDERG